jgi:hypothetical protein
MKARQLASGRVRKLKFQRDELALMMKGVEDQQMSEQPFIHAIASQICIELCRLIEGINDDIEVIEEQYYTGDETDMIQKAFAFLYGRAIGEDEIPF